MANGNWKIDMKIIADLQLHSKYARAVSQSMVVPEIARWAAKKGIGLVATGDWTHPLWLRELQANLHEAASGLFKLKTHFLKENDSNSNVKTEGEPLFLLSTEVSCIYTQGDRQRRIHILIFAPSFETVEKINKEFRSRGANLMSDGRPIMGLSSKEVAELALSVDERCLIIPAHCLLPDTHIEVNPGIKKIKDIGVGDKVLTHNGRYRTVKEVLKRDYEGEMRKVIPWYFTLGLTTTPEHPFLSIRTVKKCKSTGDVCRPVGQHLKRCTAKHYLGYTKIWTQAKDLEAGDIVLFPRLRKVADKKYIKISKIVDVIEEKNGKVSLGGFRKTLIPDKIPVDEGFLRLVGYYLSEGYAGTDDISFAFHQDEREIIDDIKLQMRRLFGISYSREYKRRRGNSIELIFHSKVVSSLFSSLFYEKDFPRRANAKRLPFWMLYLPLLKQKELLKAWWLGDKGYTNSQVLLNQMKAIYLRLGIIPSIRVDTREAHRLRGKHDKFDNREIKANYDNFVIDRLNFIDDKLGLENDPTFAKFKTKLKRRHGWMDEDYAYLPIRKIERFLYEGEVYNLEVEEDNSYTSEFATVHNCWTPWFSLYGSASGFDSIEECFGDFEKHIYAIETGLSSNPEMNWRIAELEDRSIVSFSDAHSPQKLGREATVFEMPDSKKLSYEAIRQAITGKGEARIAYTIEFYPEEGKYHYTGHRKCGVKHSPEETKTKGVVCTVCGKKLTVGVMHRVEELAGKNRSPGVKSEMDGNGVRWLKHREEKRPPYVMLVPLLEILSEALESGVSTQTVTSEYEKLTKMLAPEFRVLLRSKPEEIERISGPRVREAIMKVRKGDIFVDPGYDGEFGKVKIWKDGEKKKEARGEQVGLFENWRK